MQSWLVFIRQSPAEHQIRVCIISGATPLGMLWRSWEHKQTLLFFPVWCLNSASRAQMWGFLYIPPPPGVFHMWSSAHFLCFHQSYGAFDHLLWLFCNNIVSFIKLWKYLNVSFHYWNSTDKLERERLLNKAFSFAWPTKYKHKRGRNQLFCCWWPCCCSQNLKFTVTLSDCRLETVFHMFTITTKCFIIKREPAGNKQVISRLIA